MSSRARCRDRNRSRQHLRDLRKTCTDPIMLSREGLVLDFDATRRAKLELLTNSNRDVSVRARPPLASKFGSLRRWFVDYSSTPIRVVNQKVLTFTLYDESITIS